MRVRFVVPTLLAGFTVTGALIAGQASPGPLIEAPVAGQRVEKKDLVTVRMDGSGQPILAVRSKQPGSLWWIQESAETTAPQTFVVKARFGNEATRMGTRFEITALIAPDEEAAASLAPGASLKELPGGWLHSAVSEVVVGGPAAENELPTTAVQLVTPKPDEPIERLQRVTFQVLDAPQVAPLLLVRSGEPGSPWWVQQPLVSDGQDQWNGLARIGNDKTPAGAIFQLVLVFPDSADAADAMKPGTTLRDISQLRCSQMFTLTQQTSRGQQGNESVALKSAD